LAVQQSHTELVEACKRGDRRAMEKIYRMYARALFNTAYRITGDFHYAEDVMHEAFIKAFEHMDAYRGDAPLGAWLKRIAVNESLQWLKKYRRYETDRDEWPEMAAEDETPPDDTWQTEDKKRLAEALMKLNPRYRTVLSLHYIEGYDLQETASIMDISYANVRTLLTRAKQQLKKILEHER